MPSATARRSERFVTKTRDKEAALKFFKKALQRHDSGSELVTDRLRPYGAPLSGLSTASQPTDGRTARPRTRDGGHLAQS